MTPSPEGLPSAALLDPSAQALPLHTVPIPPIRNPAVTNATWAWGQDATCKYVGVAYTWGLGVR